MTARWEEALDALLDLYVYNAADRGRLYAEGWASSYASKGGPVARALATRLPDRIAAMAINADPFWVDPDMQTMWEAAVPGYSAERLHPADLLSQTGFVYLPRPFMWTDTHGRRTTFRAIAWHETAFEATDANTNKAYTAHGIVLMTFHRVGDADDYDLGNGIPEFVVAAPDGDPTHTSKDPAARRSRWAGLAVDGRIPYGALSMRVGDLQIDHVMPWEYGRTDHGATTDDDGTARLILTGRKVLPDFKLDATHPQNVQRPVQAMWRLMQQTIATRNATDPTRPVRRRMERASFPERKITVIRLRRPTAPAAEPGERSVEWSHRWLVSGHWRWQPYKDGIKRQIWISPYVKGPDDKPLDVRKVRVFAWDR